MFANRVGYPFEVVIAKQIKIEHGLFHCIGQKLRHFFKAVFKSYFSNNKFSVEKNKVGLGFVFK